MSADQAESNQVLRFSDRPTTPDPTFDYPDSLSELPLIIDNGAHHCRVGWVIDEEPRLHFKNVIAKSRTKKQETVELLVGNDISNLEMARWQLKTPFERNLVSQYDSQEQLLDYLFSHLGISTPGAVEHPVIMTEATCNPNYSRSKMYELLFECYHIPKVAFGVDSLFSFYNEQPKSSLLSDMDALLVGCGYHTTHILPVLGGHLQGSKCRRINLGGCHLESYLQRILQLRYPGHATVITTSRVEELIKNNCKFAVDYETEMKLWADEDYYYKNVHTFQLTTPQAKATTPAPAPEQQKEKKDQQSRRLKEINAKRREEKLIADQNELQKLLSLQELVEDEDEEVYQRALESHDLASPDELQDAINRINNTINRTLNKVKQEEREAREGSADSAATQSSIKKTKIERKVLNYPEPPPGNSAKMEQWLQIIHKKKQEVLDLRAERRRHKVDMTKRRTHASQQRMKLITELARGTKRKKEDTFGQNDDDWNVYKTINKDAGDSDSEAEQEKIDELEHLLKEYDPNFTDPNKPRAPVDLAEYYRIHMGIEQIRVPELLFQPSMIGHDQAGIAETINFVLSKFSEEEQNRLVQCVFLTGGCSQFPFLKQRMERELQAIRPFQSTFSVHSADAPVLGSWRGARKWALTAGWQDAAISKQQYEEMGMGYLKEHFASNIFSITPESTPEISGLGS